MSSGPLSGSTIWLASDDSVAVTLHDIGDGVLAEPKFATNEPIAAAFSNERQNSRSQTVRLRALPPLSTEFLAARFGNGQARFDPFADKIAFEFSDTGEESRQHTAMRR